MTRRALLTMLTLLLLTVPSRGQQGNAVMRFFPGVPSGTCSNVQLAINTSNADLYDCLSGAWNKVSGGGGGSNLWSALTAGTNSNAGTFAASGNTFDFSGVTLFKLRVGAGLTTSTNGDVGFDSTAKIWHIWQNGADKNWIVSSNLGVSGQPCLSNADGSCTFADPIVSGPDAVGVAPTKNPVQIGGLFLTTPATLTNNQVGAAQLDNKQNLLVNIAGQQLSKLLVTPDSVALPANQSVNVNQVAGTSLGATAVVNYGSTPAAVAVPGVNAFITNTPTVTANAGTNLNTSLLQLDATGAKLNLAQGSTTSGQTGPLLQGAVTTSAPSYTTAQTSPLSLNTSGALRVDGSGVTQPVSGTVTANQGSANATPWNSNVAQFGGTNVSTGTGASGAGIPRVTVSNDTTLQIWDGTTVIGVEPGSESAVAADPSLVVQFSPNSPNLTTPLNVTDFANGPVTPGTVASKSELIGCQYNTSLPEPSATQQMAVQCDPFGRPFVTDSQVINLLTQMLQIAIVPAARNANFVRGSFGRPVTSTGDAMDVNVKYPPATSDLCSGANKGNVPISVTANTVLMKGTGNARYRICAIFLLSTSAESFSVVEGTGVTCGTGTLAVIGSTTAANGPSLAANGGFTLGNGAATVASQTGFGNDLCILISGSTLIAGNLVYAF
jgi:hypothetical protein